MKFWLFLLILSASWAGYAQNASEKIDMSRIPQKKVRTLIRDQFAGNQLQDFKEVRSTYRQGQDMQGYRILESAYYIRENPELVWQTYQITSPAESWNGNMVSFGLLISKWENTVMYRNDLHYAGIDTGHVLYVNLKILKGLYNLAVGLEIVNIDSVQRSITFSYLKGGKSRGEQTIYFIPTRKGYTEIIHHTAFRSNSFLRDRYLYPYFHRIAINEFHRNMKRCLSEQNKLLVQR
ncbi:MAG: hypothetical protein JW830_05860 [Bacteroidales bacterium]|nr:hypothetical protein [Bacteroidales bacterium]